MYNDFKMGRLIKALNDIYVFSHLILVVKAYIYVHSQQIYNL